MAHDLGTTGNKATLYDERGRLLADSFCSYETFYPAPNRVEQNPEDWWRAVCLSTRELLAKARVGPESVAVVSFSGQMMGCVPLDGERQPLRNAIIWADQRGVQQAQRMEEQVGQERAYRITGHRLSPAYSAAKIMWVRDHEPDVYRRTAKFVQAKDFVVARLTGSILTDYSDASGTNLFDLQARRWSPELLEAAGIDPAKLPDAVPAATVAGTVLPEAAEATGLLPGTPVVLGGGDGSCAATGAGVVREGIAYNYLGSSSWIALATRQPIFDPERRTFNWVHLDPQLYSPCGTMQAAGASYAWVRRALCPLEEQLAQTLGVSVYELMNLEADTVPPGSENLFFLPYLMGERSPHWNPDARGAFIGLTPVHTRAHLIRATLEGISFNLRIILEAFERYATIEAIRLIGGGASGATWRRILASVYRRPVLRLAHLQQATSLGAAIAGGVGIGMFPSYAVAEELAEVVAREDPDPRQVEVYENRYQVFRELYRALEPVFPRVAG